MTPRQRKRRGGPSGMSAITSVGSARGKSKSGRVVSFGSGHAAALVSSICPRVAEHGGGGLRDEVPAVLHLVRSSSASPREKESIGVSFSARSGRWLAI